MCDVKDGKIGCGMCPCFGGGVYRGAQSDVPGKPLQVMIREITRSFNRFHKFGPGGII